MRRLSHLFTINIYPQPRGNIAPNYVGDIRYHGLIIILEMPLTNRKILITTYSTTIYISITTNIHFASGRVEFQNTFQTQVPSQGNIHHAFEIIITS